MSFPRSIALALRWPTFLFACFCLYWSLTISTIFYTIRWLDIKKKRNDILGWSRGMKRIFRIKVLKVGGDLYRDNCIYLCNHRSWADFIVDQYVTEGRSLFLSRWAVMFVFPLFMFPIRAIRAVILFKRGHIPDKDKFNRRIDKELAASPQTALAVYPEGHRSTHGESLPLKRGMLHYAYSRKLPTQIVIGANKEAIISEKHQTARFNQTVAVGYSEVLRPEEYSDFEKFMSKVQETWDKQWNTVFSAEWEGLPEFIEPDPQFTYPMDIVIKMLIITPINIMISIMAAWYTYRFARFALSFLGPLQTPFVVLVLLYVVSGFILYSKPVDALTVHENMMKQTKKSVAVADGSSNGGANGKKVA